MHARNVYVRDDATVSLVNTLTIMLWIDTPGPRAGAEACSLCDADGKHCRMLMFGGGSGLGSIGSETWQLDVHNASWTQLHSTLTPPPRIGHGLVSLPNGRAYLFGGVNLLGNPAATIGDELVLGDFWSFDSATLQWTPVSKCTGGQTWHAVACSLFTRSSTL
jgi:hypothetical protein